MPERLPRRFFRRDAITLAKALLGQRLVRLTPDGQRLAGLIVETEAYLGVEDAAAHTYRGRRTARNETMYADAGYLYVYFTYGMHHCANVVASAEDDPAAVLLRALEPTEGLATMQQHRPAARRDTDLCSGPAKLCAALQLDRNDDGTDLCNSYDMFIEQVRQRRLPEHRITTKPRVGIDAAEPAWRDQLLRFYIAENPHVSKP